MTTNTKPTFYQFNLSPFTRAITLLAYNNKIDLDFIDVDLFQGQHLSEDYATINPNQTVPCLVDGNITIWQSNSILRYLCLKYDLPEYPNTLEARIRVDNMLDFFTSDFTSSFFLNFCLVGILPTITYSSQEINEEVIEKSEPYRLKHFDFIENTLSNNSFLCGDSVTIADYQLVMLLTMGAIKQFDFSPYPNISRLLAYFKQMPHWDEINSPLLQFIEQALSEEVSV